MRERSGRDNQPAPPPLRIGRRRADADVVGAVAVEVSRADNGEAVGQGIQIRLPGDDDFSPSRIDLSIVQPSSVVPP